MLEAVQRTEGSIYCVSKIHKDVVSKRQIQENEAKLCVDPETHQEVHCAQEISKVT